VGRCRDAYHRRRMCEHFVARAAHPFRLDALWPFTERLERFGMAGFGWGAAWLASDGGLVTHRDVRAFRDDPRSSEVGAVETTSVLVHLRRPSKLSTLQLADTQPFGDPRERFAFSHNGDLRDIRDARRRYQAQGRIAGRADTEVGARWLEDAWGDCPSPAEALRSLHATFGGNANLAVIAGDGSVVHYAGNTENPVFSFRLGAIGIVSTALYSIDRSLFQLAAPDATERRLIRPGGAIALDSSGAPVSV
jgi:glutamine phosphoribosylpyrophosphate amidotransferase